MAMEAIGKRAASAREFFGRSIGVLDASYGYLCGSDGAEIFAQHADCFTDVEAQSEYAQCRDGAGRAMDGVAAAGGVRADLTRICAIMNEYLRCCRPLVIGRCGDAAWSLVSQVRTLNYLQIALEHMQKLFS